MANIYDYLNTNNNQTADLSYNSNAKALIDSLMGGVKVTTDTNQMMYQPDETGMNSNTPRRDQNGNILYIDNITGEATTSPYAHTFLNGYEASKVGDNRYSIGVDDPTSRGMFDINAIIDPTTGKVTNLGNSYRSHGNNTQWYAPLAMAALVAAPYLAPSLFAAEGIGAAGAGAAELGAAGAGEVSALGATEAGAAAETAAGAEASTMPSYVTNALTGAGKGVLTNAGMSTLTGRPITEKGLLTSAITGGIGGLTSGLANTDFAKGLTSDLSSALKDTGIASLPPEVVKGLTTAATQTGTGLLQGKDLGSALTSGITSGIGSGVGSYVTNEADLNGPDTSTADKILGNTAGAVTTAALRGGDISKAAGNALTSGALNSMINSQTSIDDILKMSPTEVKPIGDQAGDYPQDIIHNDDGTTTIIEQDGTQKLIDLNGNISSLDAKGNPVEETPKTKTNSSGINLSQLAKDFIGTAMPFNTQNIPSGLPALAGAATVAGLASNIGSNNQQQPQPNPYTFDWGQQAVNAPVDGVVYGQQQLNPVFKHAEGGLLSLQPPSYMQPPMQQMEVGNPPPPVGSQPQQAYGQPNPYIEQKPQYIQPTVNGQNSVSLNDDPSTAVNMYAAGGMPIAMNHGGISSLGGYSDGGRMLKGPGDGMSDDIPASIAGKQPARLATEEFVIPADVVSHLGNGSSEAGAKVLYKMMEQVRKARTGNPKQGKRIDPHQFMPKVGK